MLKVIENDKKVILFKDCEDLKSYLYNAVDENLDIKREFIYKKELMLCTHKHIDSQKYKDHTHDSIIDLINEFIGSFKNYNIIEENVML